MANILESIGRSQALAGATGRLRDRISETRKEKTRGEEKEVELAFRGRAEDRAERKLGIDIEGARITQELNRDKLKASREKIAHDNTELPLDMVLNKNPVIAASPTAQQRLIRLAGNKITVTEGVATISRKNIGEVLDMLTESKKLQKAMDMDVLGDFNQAKASVTNMIQNAKPGSKELPQLQQHLNQINTGISAIVSRQKPLDFAVAEEERDNEKAKELIKQGKADTKERAKVLVTIDKRIGILEKARFNAVNKGQGDNQVMTLMANINGGAAPDVAEPEGLERYLSFIDQKLLSLSDEKAIIQGNDTSGIKQVKQEAAVEPLRRGTEQVETEQVAEKRPITREEASAILEEAGGDPRKAEQIAANRGLTF